MLKFAPLNVIECFWKLNFLCLSETLFPGHHAISLKPFDSHTGCVKGLFHYQTPTPVLSLMHYIWTN
jgi:hypothetical protein